jgi:hypothetical protein
MLIEDRLADAANFLNPDALSSVVALNVSFDVLRTTVVPGIYCLLAPPLRGFERAQPRQLWRRFLKSPGHIRIAKEEVAVELPSPGHNPIPIGAGLLEERTQVSW